VPKIQALADLSLTWHFTGQLQGNKTRTVAEHFQWVHTLDRERIAVRLNEQRPHYAPPLNVCLQVSLEQEPGKGGVPPEHLLTLAQSVAQLPKLKLRGLMCIPPPRETFEEQRALFEQLADCQRRLVAAGFALDTLSMGRSRSRSRRRRDLGENWDCDFWYATGPVNAPVKQQLSSWES
jgi:pyridoxal phosphate enzyme (YggS family)